MKRITVTIPDEVYEEMRQHAKETDLGEVNISRVVRTAWKYYREQL